MTTETVVISLQRRPQRRAAFLARAAHAGLCSVRVFDAVDGNTLCEASLRARGVVPYPFWRLADSPCRFFNRELKWGEIGCSLSHHAVWLEFAASAHQRILILEDDVDFAPGFAELMDDAVVQAEALHASGSIDAPDLLYVARRPMRPHHDVLLPRTADAAEAKCRLVRAAFSSKSTAYVLWRSGAEKLIAARYLQKLIPVDDFLPILYDRHDKGPGLARPDLDHLFADAPRLNALAVRPLIAWERRGISDTEKSATLVCAAPQDQSVGSA
mmetsp:Transcript_55426/g.127388  ORF Transcript_55426/g.127388 Transcript_55426/m.127388 type:complete len:271 (-) Transcript_55426:183-995(-)